MNNIQVFIGGIEVVADKNITIKEEMLATPSTILNNCYPKSWEDDHDYYSRFFMPQDYSGCTIYRNGALIFAGVLKNSGNLLLRPTEPKYGSFQILDYKTFLSEGETLDFVIDNKTVEEAIEQVTSFIADYGFIVGNINLTNKDDMINAYSTLNKTAYDVYQYISEITQSRWFTRVIDETTVAIDFYSPELMPRANDIQYTQEYFENNNIVDIKYSYSTANYRNKQIILSDTVFASIDTNENIIANGYQNNYVASQLIGLLKEVYVNGVKKTFTTTANKNIGLLADFYYSSGSNTIEASSTYEAGTVINVVYTPLVKGRQIIFNNSEIARIENSTGRNGVISRYETRNDVLSTEELGKVAQSYIKYKGEAEITLTVETKETDLFTVGQQVYFDIPQLPQLAKDYMVKTKETQIIQTGDYANIFYVYTLTSSFNAETAINYFDNQRRKMNGNIGQDEFISRNIDINNDANLIFSDLQITELDITQSNVLNSILDSPFTE